MSHLKKYGHRGGLGNNLSERARYLKTYDHDSQCMFTGHSQGSLLTCLPFYVRHVTGLISFKYNYNF